MGSGTTLKAAKQHGKRCIGIELTRSICETACERLREPVQHDLLDNENHEIRNDIADRKRSGGCLA
jgi:DNA modification methylase